MYHDSSGPRWSYFYLHTIAFGLFFLSCTLFIYVFFKIKNTTRNSFKSIKNTINVQSQYTLVFIYSINIFLQNFNIFLFFIEFWTYFDLL